jgi:hypothetical protein
MKAFEDTEDRIQAHDAPSDAASMGAQRLSHTGRVPPQSAAAKEGGLDLPEVRLRDEPPAGYDRAEVIAELARVEEVRDVAWPGSEAPRSFRNREVLGHLWCS